MPLTIQARSGQGGRGAGQDAEAKSLLGTPLFAPPLAEAVRARMEAERVAAFDAARVEPSTENIIWLGRRTAYMGRFQEAIAVFTGGMRLYGEDPRLYRHRGHRYITIRQFDRAIADLEQAWTYAKDQPDAVEPDGQPNARNMPVSSLHSNIWYHLALARFLKGDYAKSAADWKQALTVGKNPDNLVSVSHWLYTSLRRLGSHREAAAVVAPIRSTLEVIENTSYLSLVQLYKGDRTAADLLKSAGDGAAGTSVRYGVSAWLMAEGRAAEAAKLQDAILAQLDWPSFGYIGAEADVARAKKTSGVFSGSFPDLSPLSTRPDSRLA